MTESLDENTTHEDVFNSFMSTQYAHSRQHTNTLESNKTESDYDTSGKSIDKDDVKTIGRGGEKARKNKEKSYENK